MTSLPLLTLSSPSPLSKLDPLNFRKFPLEHKNFLLQRLDFNEALAVLKEGTPVVETALYVPLLQYCIENKSLDDAEIIHAQLFKNGAYQDVFISTSLINVYMKCGAIDHARKVFDRLQRRNIVNWTTLITGYLHNSQPEDAIRVFLELLQSGCYPTNYTLGAVISACCALYSFEFGEQVHCYIIKYGLEADTSTGNSVCSLYSKCGRLESAVKAFQRIEDKNVVSWTTVISACGDNGTVDLGIKLFVNMLSENVEPNEYTLTSALSLCCAAQDLELGKQIHCFCIKFGCESSLPVKNSVMYLYLRCSQIDEAWRLFAEMDSSSLITWNAMIAGHAQRVSLARDDVTAISSGTEALKIFQMLNQSGLKPDLFTFSSVLTVCSGIVALEEGGQMHAQTIKSGYLADVVLSSALLNMYNKCGRIEDAIKVFEEMPMRTLISWTSLITGLSQHGRSKEAIQLFEEMRLTGLRPNQITFVGVLSACSHAGMVDEAEYYFNIMESYEIEPVIDHYACMVDMFVRLGRLEDAFAFVDKMNFEPNEIIWSILIAGCRSHGNMKLCFYAAEKLLELKPKGVENYILLLNLYISEERWHDVSRIRELMNAEKIGHIKDRSWISIKGKVHYFWADDKTHPQNAEVYEFLEDLLQKATSIGYVPYKSVEVPSEEDKEKHAGSFKHHSERLAIAFGLINTPAGSSIRVMKNIAMCRDCHNSAKYFSILTNKEIIVRDSKRLHRFSHGRCSCGDFGALL